MKTISDYTINCTPEQTLKAIKLGAPIQYETYCINGISHKVTDSNGEDVIIIPTAEQMIGFIIEKTPTLTTQLCGLISSMGYKQGCLKFIDIYLC